LGANGIAKYLENHGIHKIARQNGRNPLFDAALIRRIVQNPVYCGKIVYGRRRTEKVHGTRNDYRQVYKDNYLQVDGLHEAIISEDIWEQAQVKVEAQAKKYEKINSPRGEKIHLLSGLLKCPICGAGMYGNKSIKRRKDGTKYNDYFYYGCKHRNMTRGHKCDYRKQVSENKLDGAVVEVLCKLVSNKKFANLMCEKIDMEVDTTNLDVEIMNFDKTLRQCYSNKDSILSDLDNLDFEDKHYQRRKMDLEYNYSWQGK
jgi:site-specific DNA recombinase